MQLCRSLSILWHCLSLGLEWKLTFSGPVATAEFSKLAGEEEITKGFKKSFLAMGMFNILTAVGFMGVLLFSCPVVSDSETLWTAACQASLFLTISQSLPKFMFIASVILSSHLIFWPHLLLLPSIFPSIRDFSFFFLISLYLHSTLTEYWKYSPTSQF